MERRKAVTAAAAASLTFLLGAAGMTANAAILGNRSSDGVGQISPVTPTTIAGSTTSQHEVDTQPDVTTSVPSADGTPPSQVPSADPSQQDDQGEQVDDTRPATPPSRNDDGSSAEESSDDSSKVEPTEPTEPPETETTEVESPEADD